MENTQKIASRVAIALGSNLGNSAYLLGEARTLLKKAMGQDDFLQASLYETTPVDCPVDAPLFLNSVVEGAWDKSPLELLKLTQNIEKTLGRVRLGRRNEARTIDLDILYCGQLVFSSGELILPHPRLHVRRFVLTPLCEICPHWIEPLTGLSASVLLKNLCSDEPPCHLIASHW